ncbi:MAG: Ni/Fe hydrogenase subunit alpha [Rhodospirillales bacterium]|nr:Ni/Fe hydrogenase subunit alpha [Rhodospirillales bacterium]
MTERTIAVGALARVEGEGAIDVRVRDGTVHEVKLHIYEPPRFFEALLRGRSFGEAPDITARICGICPIAYMMSASQAMEDAFGVRVTGPLRDLRRLIYCGEWIESHALHVYMLHAPDFLGFQDAFEIGRTQPEVLKAGLKLKKIGNRIIEVVGGGRAVHPLNLKIGGFHRIPRKREIQTLIEPLQWAIEAARDTVGLVACFDFPDAERDYTFVALRHPDEYAITEGRLVSNRGLDIPIAAFSDHFAEKHVPHSNALHGVMVDGGGEYHVGPLARYSLNSDKLPPLAREAACEAGLGAECRNPFRSIIVRAVEILAACEEALRLARAYEEPDQACIDYAPQAGEGHGCTEAPRGICYHHYRLDDDGLIISANIVPPTSQNQRTIESDLRLVIERNLDMNDADLTWLCEQTVRNYDPCISCATHFLDLRMDRS